MMHALRSTRSTYVSAFLLSCWIALLIATPGRSAEPFRLDRLAIVRFSPANDGRLLMQRGVLDLGGDVAWRVTQSIARPPDAPEWAFNRILVSTNAWLAFHNLGGLATANFEIQGGAEQATIGDQSYMAVGVSPLAHSSNGNLINISARTALSAGNVIIVGFVVEDRPRAVLVRAVGPSLARLNVPSAHPDPWLAVKRGYQTIVGNDDWFNQADSQRVAAAAARVGAFPLAHGSFDAAILVILPPGAYTVHVASELSDVQNRDVLIEVYSVPEDVFD
jgi:hypothetical protein